MPKKILLKIIRIYQGYLSFDTGIAKVIALTDKTCRFSPSCSEYCYQAIKKYGILKGVFVGGKRFLRCHPFSRGGYDPVK